MPKRERPLEILLLETDGDLAEMIAGYLDEALSARVSQITTIGDALREELTTRHDAIILSLDAEDNNVLELVRELRVSNHAPIVLLAQEPTAEQLMVAMNLGVNGVLRRPFEMAQLCELMQQVTGQYLRQRQQRLRNRRLRKLSARILRDRRDLRERMDLICQDLVHAYRRLAQKVAESSITVK